MPKPTPKDESFAVDKFGGMLPAWDNYLLPEGQCASVTNGYLYSGGLEGWRVPKLLRNTSLSNPGFIYRVPNITQAFAQALLTFLGNPSANDTVTLGEETYTFVASINSSSAAYRVLIGASAAASATNLFAAFTYDNGAGTNAGHLYGIGTVANPAIDQTSPTTLNTLSLTPTPRINVQAPYIGTAYNTTVATESTGRVRLSWTYLGSNCTTLLGGANASLATSITGASVFLEFADPNTDVVRSPVVDDQYDRFYIASSTVAPLYNTRARIAAGQPAWLLGVPPPGCTPGVSVTGGGNTAQVGYPNTTSVGPNTGAPGANIVYLVPVTPTGAMSLNDVAAVPQGTYPTGHFVAVLYSDVNGQPTTLLNTGVPVTGITAGTTITSAFTNPTGLLLNVKYWIGFAVDVACPFVMADDTSTTGVVSQNTFSNGPPAAINNLQVGFGAIQVWGDCTASSVLEARAYVYTYISAYGEESAPSPPTTVTGWSNGTWTVNLFQPPPDQLGVVRNLTSIRLYRTLTSTHGATTYFQVTPVGGDLPITQAVYQDVITDDVVATNNQLQSQLWTPPPAGLQGFVVMPNGVIAAWQNNEIWFCEPYRPHAWPASYVLTTEYPIQGLGVTGNSVVAVTTGAPYVATGTTPGTLTAIKVQQSEPCHSRKSILGNSQGVYYCSRNGLILVDAYGTVTNTTESWITREKWQQLTPQSNVVAILLAGCYYAYQVGANGNEQGLGVLGFTVELNAIDNQSFTIWPQAGGHRLGFQLLSNPLANPLAMLYVDPWSAVATCIARNGMYYYDFSDPAPTLSVVDWTSKSFLQRTRKNFEAMRFTFTVPPNTPTQNAVRLTKATNDPVWTSPLPTDRYGFVLVYAGAQLVTAREIRVNKEVLRILSGFKHETWSIRIITRLHISRVEVGTSVKGMGNI